MTYDPAQHNRRSIRLQGFDYSTAGAYFVTLNTHNHQCLFGSIIDDKMFLTDAGRMIHDVWQGLPERLEFVRLDEYIVMPNHFHAILFINSRGEPCVRPSPHACDATHQHEIASPHGTTENSLGRVIQAFKSLCTHAYVEGVSRLGWPRYNEKLWQRNYYERVLRNDDELRQKREYIDDNVLKWALDPENHLQQ